MNLGSAALPDTVWPGLSLEAIGLLSLLLGSPMRASDNPVDLAQKFCGRDRAYRVVGELIDARLLSRRKLSSGAMEYAVEVRA